MAMNRRGRITLRQAEYEALMHQAGRASSAVAPKALSRAAYRELLDAVDSNKTLQNDTRTPSNTPRRLRSQELLRVAVVTALGLLMLAGCRSATSYRIDTEEREVARTRAPLQPVAMEYSVRVMRVDDGLALHIDQLGRCPTAEQRLFERPDVPARRMRTRFATYTDPAPVPCERRGAQGAEVALKGEGAMQLLGRTDAQGVLVLPAWSALPVGQLYVNRTLAKAL